MRKRELTQLGVQIKTRLNELGMTQYELSQQLGMNYKYLYLIMVGERSGKSYMRKIGELLDIDPKLSKTA